MNTFISRWLIYVTVSRGVSSTHEAWWYKGRQLHSTFVLPVYVESVVCEVGRSPPLWSNWESPAPDSLCSRFRQQGCFLSPAYENRFILILSPLLPEVNQLTECSFISASVDATSFGMSKSLWASASISSFTLSSRSRQLTSKLSIDCNSRGMD